MVSSATNKPAPGVYLAAVNRQLVKKPCQNVHPYFVLSLDLPRFFFIWEKLNSTDFIKILVIYMFAWAQFYQPFLFTSSLLKYILPMLSGLFIGFIVIKTTDKRRLGLVVGFVQHNFDFVKSSIVWDWRREEYTRTKKPTIQSYPCCLLYQRE